MSIILALPVFAFKEGRSLCNDGACNSMRAGVTGTEASLHTLYDESDF